MILRHFNIANINLNFKLETQETNRIICTSLTFQYLPNTRSEYTVRASFVKGDWIPEVAPRPAQSLLYQWRRGVEKAMKRSNCLRNMCTLCAHVDTISVYTCVQRCTKHGKLMSGAARHEIRQVSRLACPRQTSGAPILSENCCDVG